MIVETHRIGAQTRGDCHIIDMTRPIRDVLSLGRVRHGTVTVFVVGSTAAITTTEYEPGLVNQDLKTCFEKIAPADAYYQHETTWNDDNGHAHVRASLVGPSLTVPLVDGRMTLGQWQQIVLMDFDTRPRERQIVVQVMGKGEG